MASSAGGYLDGQGGQALAKRPVRKVQPAGWSSPQPEQEPQASPALGLKPGGQAARLDELLAMRPKWLSVWSPKTPSTKPRQSQTHPAWGRQDPVSLRWVLAHMIEEYARHNGHADLIRESIDGQTGD